MIGLILIVLTWFLLRLERKNLTSIGFNKPLQRSLELVAGIVVAALFCLIQNVLSSSFGHFEWKVNTDFGVNSVLESFRWVLNSVLYEELLFRGYLFFKAIQLFGGRLACLISSVAFGIYHWFSYEVFGQPITMFYVFILTAIPGLMFSYAFLRTQSIILPIGLHLGWNIMNIIIFSKGSVGQQLLFAEPASGLTTLNGWDAILVDLVIPLSLPLLVIVFLKYSSCYAKKQQS
ncbi:CPBP family intramembrane metalloprotease [Kangiella sp. HD9-110m-PIT-SAG06]|nr:CPBP family intramembrane metalloprotease [Kangiella sp. HD9-110m-PIT-SAG06]